MKFSLVFVTGLVSCVIAAPALNYRVHEKREFQPAAWIVRDVNVDARASLPLSIGLTQRNLENGHDYLMDISDPESPNYGKHWTAEQVAETFTPAQETIDAVMGWLAESGISKERVTLSKGSTWVRVDSTVGETETLLKTKYKIYEHTETKQPHIACEEYSVPSSLSAHIDFVTPTIHFDSPTKLDLKRDVSKPEAGPRTGVVAEPMSGIFSNNAQSASSLSTCANFTTPECLRALYKIPNGTYDKSSYGIVEYTPDYYMETDLDLFYSVYAPRLPAGTRPKRKSIDGAPNPQDDTNLDDLIEASLDLQYGMSLVYPQKVTVYQVGDINWGLITSFNNFLDALDKSYCTSGGGDDPLFDAIYPDTQPGGYKKQDCGTESAPAVLSTSYGYQEADLSAAYEIRQCNEYMKLGLQGVTVIYSSGDNGVAGYGNACCSLPGCAGTPGANTTPPNSKSGAFVPTFPSTCPYVTSVGATQIEPGAPVTAPEEACQEHIYSGGGFSNVFPIPAYQKDAQKYYFSHNSPDYTAAQYNNSQAVRGYPDLAANGAHYPTALDGNFYRVYGTSASAPVVGAIITLINNERAKVGKGSVGFINPTIYKNTGAFNDIKKGGNKGCGTSGFRAVTGWDPVTGLGTPDYQKLLQVFIALP